MVRAIPFKSVVGGRGMEDFLKGGRGRILNHFIPPSPPNSEFWLGGGVLNFEFFLGGGVPDSELWLERGGVKFLFSFRSSSPNTFKWNGP